MVQESLMSRSFIRISHSFRFVAKYYYSLIFFSQPFIDTDIKAIFSSQALQNQRAGQMWPVGLELAHRA